MNREKIARHVLGRSEMQLQLITGLTGVTLDKYMKLTEPWSAGEKERKI